MYVPICYIASEHTFRFFYVSLVGSTTILMTYGINVRPYNDPYIKMVEEAVEAAAELSIAGAFLVDMSLNGSPVPSFRTTIGNMRQ